MRHCAPIRVGSSCLAWTWNLSHRATGLSVTGFITSFGVDCAALRGNRRLNLGPMCRLPSFIVEMWATPLRFEGLAFEGPSERFRESGIKIVNKSNALLVQVLHRAEAAAFEEASRQNAKPELDLIEP